MIDLAVTVWVLALLATSALFVGVVAVQAVARLVHRVGGRSELTVTVLVPPTAAQPRIAA